MTRLTLSIADVVSDPEAIFDVSRWATELRYRELMDSGLCFVGQASQCAMLTRQIYRADVVVGHPKLAFVAIRSLHQELDRAGQQMADFRALLLGIAADLEVSLSPQSDSQP